MLEGGVEITASDGESRAFEPGDVLLVEDVDGKGYASRALQGQRRRTLFIAADLLVGRRFGGSVDLEGAHRAL